MHKSKIMKIGVVSAVLCATSLGAGAVYAASNGSTAGGQMTGLVSAIAQRFGLNESDVQAVFDAERAEMQTAREEERDTRFSERLTTAVAEGRLTQAQADLITAKRAELEEGRTSLEGLTGEERRTAMQAERAALRQWAEDNGIPMEFCMFEGGMRPRGEGERGGPRGMGGFMHGEDAETSIEE